MFADGEENKSRDQSQAAKKFPATMLPTAAKTKAETKAKHRKNFAGDETNPNDDGKGNATDDEKMKFVFV